jgi:1-acyl-sn-glycerol-3-phosphate acyltransferase
MRTLLGLITTFILIANTLFWCAAIYPLALLRFVLPPVRKLLSRAMVACAENWISVNSWFIDHFYNIRWHVEGLEGLQHDCSYLVCVNHQSWIDIVVLQRVFNRRIPFLRFFIKKELVYVPLLGFAWLALDFPMMKRHSKEYLAKYPEKRGEDLETTRRICERLRGHRLSVLNFLEGTRFTEAKHKRQESPYKHLLKPKVGGLAFVLQAMGDQFHSLLDVTIFYPDGAVNLWGLLTGRLTSVVVQVREVRLTPDLIQGDYLNDEAQRERMQNWVQDIWERKDALLEKMSHA